MQLIFILLSFLCISSCVYGQNSLVWKFETNKGVYSSPAVDDHNVYIGSNDSCLYALNKTTGKLVWKYKTMGEIKSKPLLHNKTVVFNSTDGGIYALNTQNGELVWRFNTEGEKCADMWDYYLSSPVADNKSLFVGSGDGNVYSLNPETGKLLWKYRTEGIVHASPLINDNKVYIGSFDGNFYALNAADGSLVWKFKTVGDAYFPRGEIQKGAALYKNSVIFGSRDFNIYALNIESGRGIWNMKERGSWIIATPSVHDDCIYFGTSDTHRFYGMEAKSGEIKWSILLNMRVYGEAVPFENKIIYGCFNGKLYSLDHLSGKLDLLFQTEGSKQNYYSIYKEDDSFREGFELYGSDMEGSERRILELGAILSTPIIDNGFIYFGDANGVIYAIKLY